jgi:phospholipid/cholesterol/gamma-HCH transport system ATP-binding protein
VHDKVSFDIRRGEILGIAGGSGSGKSVLLKTLTGLHRPNAGEILLNGKPIAAIGNTEKATLIGRPVPARRAVLLAVGRAEHHAPMREHYRSARAGTGKDRGAMKLELAGLPVETGSKFPSELSGGMVKRAAVARALSLEPENPVPRRADLGPGPAHAPAASTSSSCS